MAIWMKFATFLLMILNLQASKLNVPRVLLPYNNDFPSNFTLKVHDGGCYKWTSSREDVVLHGIDNEDGCYNDVTVSAVTKSSARQTAIIIAKDSDSGLALRCDVIIDSIYRLEIVTTTRELYVEEAPEEFEVRAYDVQGNEFSTLEGQEFIWDLQTITDHDAVVPAQTVLRFMWFSASPYETPRAISPLEEDGRQGYMVLIEGRQTGLARLTVRMAHLAYKELPPSSVDLMVIANLILEPQDVYVLPHTTILYSVYNLKQGVFHPLDIEGSQYSIKVSSPDIGQLEGDGISVTGLIHGTTQVILRDNNVKISQTLKEPTAHLHVVEPSFITITIAPHNNPALINGRNYIFLVNIYDKNNNKIYLDSNIRVRTTTPSEYIIMHFTSNNGTYLEGQPIRTGNTKITAILSSIKLGADIVELSPPLKAVLALEISDQIRITPHLTILPWDPITMPTYNVNLTVLKAVGSVMWHSNDTNLVTATQSGMCVTKGLGSSLITAALKINDNNKDSALIVILEALGLSIIESVVEAEVLNPLLLPVSLSTMYDGKSSTFTMCDQLNMNVEAAENSFDALEDILPPTNEKSCCMVQVMGRSPGFSMVTITYSSSSGDLMADVTVGAYDPLKVINPRSGETVLALGSSRVILFEGGPLPWIHKPSSHFTTVSLNTSEFSTASLISSSLGLQEHRSVHAVWVECNTLGATMLTLEVGNKPSNRLRFPMRSSVSVQVICALPDSVILQPRDMKQGCPAMHDLGMAIAPCSQPLPIQVFVQDSEGRIFDNISSLALDWSVSNSNLAEISNEDNFGAGQTVHGFSLPMQAEQSLVPLGNPGNMSVSVELSGYIEASDHIKSSFPNLKASLVVMLVHDVEIRPSSIVLFNHIDNEGEFLVLGGSGYFQLQRNHDDVSVLTYLDDQWEKRIVVSPLSDGESEASLIDLCIDRKPAIAGIRVSSLFSLDLVLTDKMQIGSTIEATVIVKSASGSPIPYHPLMELRAHPHSKIINASYSGVNDELNAIYKVVGLSVGDTSLRVSAGKNVYSPTRPLQVFPPLEIMPRNVTLIVGAMYQVEVRGGPYPSAEIEFLMKNESVAISSHTGLITAIALGTSILNAKAMPQMRDSGTLPYSQDVIYVNVVPLPKIRIEAPLKYLEVGSSMPLYAMGLEESLTPMAFATAIPPLLFDWTINNKHVGSLTKVYIENGITEPRENCGIVRLNSLKSGRVSISLKVKTTVQHSSMQFQTTDNIVLSDKLEVKFFEPLGLTKPKTMDAKLLMTPNSETQITTNRESDGHLSYSVNCPGNSKGSLIAVSSKGIVTANSEFGDSSVLVTLEEVFGVTQTLVVLVEIRPVVYLQSNVLPFMQLEGVVNALPVGITHTMIVSHHDARGRTFDAVSSRLAFRPSRFDLVSIGHGANNQSLTVSIKDQGQTVVQIYDEEWLNVRDYVKINSASGISPDKPNVPLGSPLCMSSPLRSINAGTGIWTSVDSSIFEVDPVSGIGIAHSIGKTTVSYEVSPMVSTSVEILVAPISKLSVVPSSDVVSNIQAAAPFLVPVSVQVDGVQSPMCMSDMRNVVQPPFQCYSNFSPSLDGISAEDVFETDAVFISGRGFYCMLKPLQTSLMATMHSGLFVRAVAMSASSKSSVSVQSDEVQVPFYIAATVDQSEITLNDQESSGMVTITGHMDLLQSFLSFPDDSNLITATLGEVNGNTLEVFLITKDGAWHGPNQTSVTLISSLTHQSIKINISFEQVESGTCADPGKHVGFLKLLWSILRHNQGSIISAISVIIIISFITIAYRLLFGPGYKQTQQPGVLASSPAPPPRQFGQGYSPGGQPVPTGYSSPPDNLRRQVTSPSNISLWSVDREPIYGDPMFRTSPKMAYEGSPTYKRPNL